MILINVLRLPSLGRVDGFDQDNDKSQRYERGIIPFGFLAPQLKEPIEY